MDCIDNGLSRAIPDLASFLPGLNRSAFLASQEQLDNLVREGKERGEGEKERGVNGEEVGGGHNLFVFV